MDTLVTVIVPVYKVESYFGKCVDSIICQTYTNLEIILVNDGSPDGCGAMCDQYAAADRRVKVIHQSNKGLSQARNSGIDICEGAYILFVDGDDWIERNTVACLLKACIEYGADAACCGHYKEFTDRSISYPLTAETKCYEGDEIVVSAMRGSFAHYAWEKLWKRELFNTCRFPPGILFEDIATTWKLFLKCRKVVCIPDALFHYNYRKDSLGNTKNMKNLADRWIAFKERYDVMAGKSDVLCRICTKGCLETIGYTWRWLYKVQDRDEELLSEMRAFLKENRSFARNCSPAVRFSLFCASHSNTVTVFTCYWLNQLYRKTQGLDQMA